jgi:hypothetical protein
MAKPSIVRSYRGRARDAVPWQALLRIFNAISADERLCGFPYKLGRDQAFWYDASGAKYEGDSLDEVHHAYQQDKAVLISFCGWRSPRVRYNFVYLPADGVASIRVQAQDQETVDGFIAAVRQEFPHVAKYVFISYETREYCFARYTADILQRRLAPEISVFVAKRDIKPGEHPLKVILEQQLRWAEALIALCSQRSKFSPWLWWESATIWARGGLVVPLFLNISPDQFNGPITHVTQGRYFFEVPDIHSILQAIVDKVCPDYPFEELTPEEIAELDILRSHPLEMPDRIDPSKWLHRSQASRVYRISNTTLSRWAKSGKVRCQRLANLLLVYTPDIEEVLRKRQV